MYSQIQVCSRCRPLLYGVFFSKERIHLIWVLFYILNFSYADKLTAFRGNVFNIIIMFSCCCAVPVALPEITARLGGAKYAEPQSGGTT